MVSAGIETEQSKKAG